MFQVVFNATFFKAEAKFFKKHPELKTKFKKIFKQLEKDPFAQNLKTHKLKGKLKDYHACSLESQYRIILTIVVVDKLVYLVNIGSHDDVYNH
ncbi:HigB toxin protein [uncultured Candidatus Thioglobus sp.]|nr:HigB toxin protein [uncultured Candidatus Thioglobus sp.]